MRFKLRTVLICFALLCISFSVSAQGAEYLPSGGGTLSLIGEDGFEKTSVSGKSAVIIDNSAAAVFNVDDSVIFGNAERKKVTVSVTYLDEGGGFFYLTYDSFSGAKEYSDFEEIIGTQTVKTRSFTLYDAKFANSVSGGDFSVTMPKRKYTTVADAYYKPLKVFGVSVEISDESCPVTVSATTKSPGNIFFDGDEREFDVSFENKFSVDADVNVKYEATGIDGSVVFAKTDVLSLSANGKKDINIPVGVKNYGVYTFNVYLTDNGGNDIGSYSYKFSVCLAANYEGYDSQIGICPHFNWGRECDNGTYIIKNAGIDHIREGYNWATFEWKKGYYDEKPAMKNYLDAAEKYGIDVLALAAYGNTVYSATAYDIPNTNDYRTAYANYVYNMLDKNRGRIKVVEIWNEPDIPGFNKNNATPEDCARLVKAVYDRIHTDFPDVEICAFALANAYNSTGLEWLERAVKTDTDGDGEYDLYKYCDGISVHHYIGDLKRISTDGEKLKTLLANYGFADKKLYHTEFGYTETIRSNGKWVYRGEEKQASFLAKYASSLRAKKSGDRFYIYDFSNDGLAENQPEQNFGLVEGAMADVPYAAKPAFIAIANMNRVIGDCETGEVVRDGNDLTVYKFTKDTGEKTGYVMFSENGSGVYDLYVTDEKVYFYDMYGNEILFGFDGEKYTAEVGTNPVYAVVYTPHNECETYLENGRIVVNGMFSFGDAGEKIGAKVFDKNGQLVYLNQLELSDENTVNFSFSAKDGEEYTVMLGMKSRTSVYVTSAEGTGKAKISIEKNGGEIGDLFSLASAESISICAEIFDRAVDNFTVAAAAYKNGALCEARLINKNDMAFDGRRYTLEIASDTFKDADTAGFYIFNSADNIMPIDKGIKLVKTKHGGFSAY